MEIWAFQEIIFMYPDVSDKIIVIRIENKLCFFM